MIAIRAFGILQLVNQYQISKKFVLYTQNIYRNLVRGPLFIWRPLSAPFEALNLKLCSIIAFRLTLKMFGV